MVPYYLVYISSGRTFKGILTCQHILMQIEFWNGPSETNFSSNLKRKGDI